MPLAKGYRPRPKTNSACPARLHGTATAHRKPRRGRKCICAEALQAVDRVNERDRKLAEARRAEAKRIAAGEDAAAPPPPPPATPTDPVVETGSEVFSAAHRPSCKDEDPELWFPVGDSGPALQQLAEAKAICRRCPVQRACLDLALSMKPPPVGVWGGSDEDERDAIRRGPFPLFGPGNRTA